MVVVGAVAMLLCQVRGGDFEFPADPVVATINNEKVTASEYRLIMDRKTAEVFSLMKLHHNLDDHPGYWSKSSGPEGPLAKLRAVVLDELVRIKVCQGLAKERGLIQDTTFAAFQADFMQENSRRKEAKSLGKVVYGPAQYTMAAYYYVRFGDLIHKLKQAMAKEFVLKITENEIEEFYKKNKDVYASKPLDEIRQRILDDLSVKEAKRKLETLYPAATVEVHEQELRGVVPRLDPEPDKL